jgi:4-amino-4-deoxy-L-arabinose transferase-like glycosyltransferase
MFIRICYFYMALGIVNIAAGLGLWKCKDAAVKKLGVLTWLLEMAVAGFVFVSIFFIRLDWGVLPFYAGLRRWVLTSRILIPVGIFLAGFFFISHFENKIPAAKKLALLIFFSFSFHLGIVAVHPSFVGEVTRTFNRRGLEYYGDVAKVDSDFVYDYINRMPELSLHGKTHPPTAVLFLWGLTRAGFGIFGVSIATAFLGSLTLVFVFGIAKDLFGEEAAMKAAEIFWLAPAVVLYSAVSMDALFMFLCAAAVFFFQRALYKIHYTPLAAFSFTLALFSTFAAGFLLPVFAVWAGLNYSHGRMRTLRNLAWTAGWVVLFHLAFYLVLNYNVVEVFFRAVDLNTAMMGSPRLGRRPYGYWMAGNLVDYFTFLGFPLFSLACLYGRRIKKKSRLPIFPSRRFYPASLFSISPA